MNSNLQFAVAVAVFAITYYIVTLFQPERGLYNRFEKIMEAQTGSLLDLSSASKDISNASTDKDLKFAADFFSTGFQAYHDIGFSDAKELNKAGSIEVFSKSFISSITDPIGGISNFATFLWIIWNQSDCVKALSNLENKYGGINYAAIIWGLITTTIAYFMAEDAKNKPPIRRGLSH